MALLSNTLQGYVAHVYSPSEEEHDGALGGRLMNTEQRVASCTAQRQALRRQLGVVAATVSAGALLVAACSLAARRTDSDAVAVERNAPFLGLVNQHGAGSDCSGDTDNCWLNRCCSNPKHKCFMKDAQWAGCMEDCTPGEHKTDPAAVRTPWKCYVVQKSGPALPPPGTKPEAPAVVVQAAAAPPPAAAVVPAASKGAEADGLYPKLFCFAIIRTGTYELDLVKTQYSLHASIFACEGWSVLSDKVAELSVGVSTTPLGDLSTGSGVKTHFANTDIFSRAFDLLRKEGHMMTHDFIVKVDPDAVFMPNVLKVEIQKYAPKPGEGQPAPNMYFQNCQFAGKLWMFGAAEVLSRAALNAYFGGRDTTCKSQLDYYNMGEDTFLSRCLDRLGVKAVQDFNLLADGYCDEAPGTCQSNQVTYHPFKDAGSWAACFHAASASR